MFKPKAQSWSTQGSNHSINDDSVLVNPEQGIYVICDGVSEGGEGRFASKLVAQTVHEKLGEARRRMRTEGMQFIGAKRLQIMQEATLPGFFRSSNQFTKKIDSGSKLQTCCDHLHIGVAGWSFCNFGTSVIPGPICYVPENCIS